MTTPGDEVLAFIKECIRDRRILWTYHVTMRLAGRFIQREMILGAIDSLEIIESYPEDKYLPSYLLLARHGEDVFHVHVAVDKGDENVRIITAYRPTPDRWEEGFRKRRKS
jgi:hypothetical protein